MTRLDLPFVTPRPDGGGIKSHWHVDHDPHGSYYEAKKLSESYFDQVVKLAEFDEWQAHMAMRLPMNSGCHSNWGNSGWGNKCGFSEAMAAAAIVGLRCIRLGLAKPYDYQAALQAIVDEALAN